MTDAARAEAAAARPAIALEDVALTLGSRAGPVDILRSVSLTIGAGETVGIVGPSGSGKSSLLMVLGGLERATAGRVDVLGADLPTLDEDALARFRRDNMGVVFQSFHLVPTLTALENVATPLEIAGARDAFERARAELDRVGLGHRGEHYPAELSGGEQQRVALARAVVGRPALLLADEPTGNLDDRTGSAIADLLFDLGRESGATLVIVTHSRRLAERCGRIVRLRDGQVEAEETAPATEAAE
ncbi:MAG: ABC transporter ATP-binding protein [Paracoccaceae bacterium]